METLTHGAKRCSESSRDRGRSIQYTFHSWRRCALALTSENSILVFDLRQMRLYAFADGECLVHKISCAVSNQTQGRLILWVKLTSEQHTKSMTELSEDLWQRCLKELSPFQDILTRFLYYYWFAQTF